jgi:hypothetical protein
MNQKLYKKILLALIACLLSTNLTFNLSSYTDLIKASLFIDFDRNMAKLDSQTSTLAEDLQSRKYTTDDCQVAVVGGGSGGFAAAVQSARNGVKTCLIEETDWLGGMLTSAGVSAIDGHPETASGIFKEIREKIIHHYYVRGEIEQMRLCKVSTLCFEPSIGNKVMLDLAKNTNNLTVYLDSKVKKVYREGNKILGVQFIQNNRKNFIAAAKVTIDATEFGDLMYVADIPFDLGIDPESTEPLALEAENCVQPLTYVAILKKQEVVQKDIKQPKNYDSENYSCLINDSTRKESSSHFDINHLLNYGKLPNDKLMLNIPSHSCGNDFHATAAEFDDKDREEVLDYAKDYTLGFVYYMQNELGIKNYKLYNEFKTKDKLAKTPYVRESRRLVGVKRIVEQDLTQLNDNGRPNLVNSSIAIGDYPIDLHYCTTGIGDVFKAVKPYQIPYEVLVPKEVDGFLAAEKNISVTHIVNGTTRLQPVVMSVGQAAGAAAAIAVQDNVEPRNISINKLQDKLIASNSNIFYFTDLDPAHFAYKDVIKLTINSVIKGNPDMSYKPNDTITKQQFLTLLARAFKLNETENIPEQLRSIGINLSNKFNTEFESALTYEELISLMSNELLPYLKAPVDAQPIPFRNLNNQTEYDIKLNQLLDKKIITTKHPSTKQVTRGEIAVILGRILN